jgi:flavin reductase (DIM6/NTAB) family NADH-FMN oxidoreductase RutF
LTTANAPSVFGRHLGTLLDAPPPYLYDDLTMDMLAAPSSEGSDDLRAAMRAWTTGVAIVTVAHQGRQHGMTVSSFTSISLEPPLIVISLSHGSQTHDLIRLAGAFGVTILAASQQGLSERFADKHTRDTDRLAGLQTETFVSGAPFIKGGLAFLDCKVTQTIDAGMNTLFIAQVTVVRGADHDAPLVYHDRAYRRLQE